MWKITSVLMGDENVYNIEYIIYVSIHYTIFSMKLMCYKSLYSSKYLKLLTIWIKLLRLIYILTLGLSASSKTVCKEGPFCGGGKKSTNKENQT